MSPPSVRPAVTVYTRAGCGLCRDAEALVARVAAGVATVQEVDVDSTPELYERYTVRVPVVAVDGVEIAEHHVDEAILVGALRRAGALL